MRREKCLCVSDQIDSIVRLIRLNITTLLGTQIVKNLAMQVLQQQAHTLSSAHYIPNRYTHTIHTQYPSLTSTVLMRKLKQKHKAF